MTLSGLTRFPGRISHTRLRFTIAAARCEVWGFLSQHLVVLLDPNEIVDDMQEAYARVRLDRTAYGCFMMGPSATGDIEATLVHGAQGVRSLNVLFLSTSSG